MFYNIRCPVILFLVSFKLQLLGMFLRLMHWPGVQFVSWVLIIVQIVSIAWLMSIFFKSRFPLLAFMVSFIAMIMGLMFKILHWPNAQLITGGMIVLQIVFITSLIIIMLNEGKSLKQKA